MPNPFVRQGPANTSKNDVDDPSRPTGMLTPEPEHVAGPVFPYRGQETHGVEVGGSYRDPESYEGYEPRGVVVYSDPPEQEPDPIPVRVVQHGSRELRLFRTFHGFAGGTTERPNAVNLVPADLQTMNRRRVYIRNMSAKRIYLGNDQSTANAMNGWPLEAAETWDTDSHDDIWALGTDTTTTPLEMAVRVEYAVQVNDGPNRN